MVGLHQRESFTPDAGGGEQCERLMVAAAKTCHGVFAFFAVHLSYQ